MSCDRGNLFFLVRATGASKRNRSGNDLTTKLSYQFSCVPGIFKTHGSE